MVLRALDELTVVPVATLPSCCGNDTVASVVNGACGAGAVAGVGRAC